MSTRPYYPNPTHHRYEESRRPESPVADTYYQDVEPSQPKQRSNSFSSIWSRRSSKRTPVAQQPQPQRPVMQRPASYDATHANQHGTYVGDGAIQQSETNPSAYLTSPRSIVPDPMRDVPTWFTKDTPIPSSKVHYRIHNPHGPRWYKNHHLIPPSQVRPSVRPPSFFSPSFPPISTTSMPDHSDERDLSRTPSHSPLPTPNSSQTRVVDPGAKARSRKTSQTAPDIVDLLDVTDPWGTNWHHQSPYDLAISTNTNNEFHEPLNARSRRASVSGSNGHHKSVAPSPLSQSTSAVHLQPPTKDSVRMPRKLSKRKTPAVGTIFAQQDRKAASAPVTPTEHSLVPSFPPETSTRESSTLPKRMSVAPTMSAPSNLQQQTISSKKDKRGSVLGRLAKKFSILRRPSDEIPRPDLREDSWHHVNPDDTRHENGHIDYNLTDAPAVNSERPFIENMNHRVAPSPEPPMDDRGSGMQNAQRHARDRSSSISVETPFSMGRLTIANPDVEPESPTSMDLPPVPPEKPRDLQMHAGKLGAPANSPSPSPVKSPPPVFTSRPLSGSPTPISLYLAPLVSVSSEAATPVQPPLQPTQSRMSTHSNHSTSNTQQLQAQVNSADDRRSSVNTAIPNSEYSQTAQPARSTENSHAAGPSTARYDSSATSTLRIPFPVASSSDPLLAPPDRLSSLMSYDNSPLSTTSMLANPPTPLNGSLSITATPETIPPPLPPKAEKKRPSREPSPIDKTLGRQTETFKLIRSASGHVYASGETIVAAGQQWEVVESTESKGKSRQSSSKSKDKEKEKEKESSSRSEREKEARERPKVDIDTDERHRKSGFRTSSHHHTRPTEVATPSKSNSRPETRRRDSSHKDENKSSQRRDAKEDDYKSSRRRDEPEEDSSSRKRSDRDQDHRSERRREEKEKEENRKSSRKRDDRDEDHRSRRKRDERDDDRRSPRKRDEKEPEHRSSRRREEKEKEDEHRSSRKRTEPKEQRTERKTVEAPVASSSDVYLSRSAPAPSVEQQPEPRPLERHPSMSARPTSELPSAADMNALRAKEAWEMERLWRARSMYGTEPNAGAVHYIQPNGSSVFSDDANVHNAVHGSSHTAFVVQTPFQGQGSNMSNIYHSMPLVPPPFVFSSSPPSIPSIHGSASSYDHPYSHPQYANSYTSPPDPRSIPVPSRSNNPLPEPPRESPYRPAPLLPPLQSNRRSATNDYWTTKYKGITTAH